MNNKEQKEFIFPENVSSDYGVFLDLSLKEILIYLVPEIMIGLIVLFIPPHSITVLIIELIFFILLITITLGVLSSNPVKNRPNIRLPQYLKMKKNYSLRQHLYFKKTKNERK